MSSRSSKKTRSDDRVEVGRVLRSHGVRGEVAVEPFSDVEGRFSPGAELLAGPRAGSAAGRPGFERLTIDSVRPHRGALLIRFAGIEDRDAADALRGAVLEVPREAVPAPPEGTWYHFQLEGCRCRDARLGDLGEVTGVVEDGGGVLLVVEGQAEDGARRLLVPFVRAFVREVAADEGRIELDLPEGLIEACASKS